ncbi:DUF4157 domain-containing protein [Chloroflexia bacterium SDU3-3]|nr:DUF4157 domain-containing protein [Chloroflexia bacterium SDU3-3]
MGEFSKRSRMRAPRVVSSISPSVAPDRPFSAAPIQRRSAALATHSFGKVALHGRSSRPVQRRSGGGSQPQAASQPSAEGTATTLPKHVKSGVEQLSGVPMDDVRVHLNSSAPADVGALAYTQGADIHVAPGQEQHIAHEAWHVVQQKQGRVRASTQFKGVEINDDAGLEAEADAMGAQAMRLGSSAEEAPAMRQGEHEVEGAENAQGAEETIASGPVQRRADPKAGPINRQSVEGALSMANVEGKKPEEQVKALLQAHDDTFVYGKDPKNDEEMERMGSSNYLLERKLNWQQELLKMMESLPAEEAAPAIESEDEAQALAAQAAQSESAEAQGDDKELAAMRYMQMASQLFEAGKLTQEKAMDVMSFAISDLVSGEEYTIPESLESFLDAVKTLAPWKDLDLNLTDPKASLDTWLELVDHNTEKVMYEQSRKTLVDMLKAQDSDYKVFKTMVSLGKKLYRGAQES